jgi:hypothetical protein
VNVRFYAGYKSDYLNLPEHNQLALYFCYDTQELYWGDLCISDGIRVIPTHADLPELSRAADGIVYYVAETHNGYTLSPDRTEWFQTIYAPAPDAYEVPESEIYKTVTTVGAVRKIENELLDKIAAIDAKVGNNQNINLEEYYTKAEVAELIAAAIAELDIPDISGFIKEIPSEYVTEDELNEKGYLTEHQSLDGYAKKEDLFSKDYNELINKPAIPSIEGLATESFVTDAIKNIPEVDVSNFITSEALDSALVVKAADVPFTTDKYVQKAAGSFLCGDNVKGLTVAEILTKLLALSDVVISPDEPHGIVENIMANKTSMHQINDNDIMVEVPYVINTYTEQDAPFTNDGISGFYVVTDNNGTRVEAGYQHFSTQKDPYYIVALPEELEVTAAGNVTLQTWDTTVTPNKWTDAVYVLTSDYDEIVATYNVDGITPPVAPNDYRLWADLSTNDPGTSYRFVIKE